MEYFVSSQGNDDNPGTAELPFLTIGKAAEKVVAGDVVTVLPGVYQGNIKVQADGTAEKPIVFQGVRGKDGKWESVIDGGEKLHDWQPAPEVGKNVWWTKFDSPPRCVTMNGKQIITIGPVRMKLERKQMPAVLKSEDLIFANTPRPYDKSKLISGLDLLTVPDDMTIANKQINWRHPEEEFPFWETLSGVMAGYLDGKLYCRMTGGRNPNDYDFRAGGGDGFIIADHSYIVIRDFMIRGTDSQVLISGNNAGYNTISDNWLQNGRQRVSVTAGAHNTVIANNCMTLGFIGAKYHSSATWQNNRLIYLAFKYIVSDRQTSDDHAIDFSMAGDNNMVEDNIIFQGLCGMEGRNSGLTTFRRNVFREMSSCGFVASYGTKMNIHDNLLLDNGINMRVHSYRGSETPRQWYIYRNWFKQPGAGMQLFVHCSSNKTEIHEQIYFYHNTFYQSGYFLNPASFEKNFGDEPQSIVLLNNLVAMSNGHVPPVKVFAGNAMPEKWTEAETKLKTNAGTNALIDKIEKLRADDGFPLVKITEDSKLKNKAVEIKQELTINNVYLGMLPGMEEKMTDPGAFKPGRDLERLIELYYQSEKIRQK